MKQRATLRGTGRNTMYYHRRTPAACGFAPQRLAIRETPTVVTASGEAPSLILRLLRTLLLTSCFAVAAIPVEAQPTQEEVFRSIGQNVSEPVDSKRVLAVVLGVAGVVALLMVISHSRRPEARPKSPSHQGRLLKEVLKSVPVKPAELKELKALVHEARSRDENGPQNPLTLLLCPSVLAREAQRNPQKVNRKVLAGLFKRMGLLRAA